MHVAGITLIINTTMANLLATSTNTTTKTTMTSSSTSSPCPIRKAFIQAQSIRSLRAHSSASLRSSLDGEELGSEKLQALVAKFKHDVEEQDEKDDNHTSLSLTDDDDDEDDDEDSQDQQDEAAAQKDDDARTKATTTTSTTTTATVATNEQVRSKLLNRLGIQSTTTGVQREANPQKASIRQPSYELPLNDAGDYENWNQRKLVRRSPFSFFSSSSGVTDDSADDSESCSSSFIEDEQFSSDGDNGSSGTSNGPSLTASEGTPGLDVRKLDPSMLINPLAFNKSRNVFGWMNTNEISEDDSTMDQESTKDYTKASF